MKQIFSPLLFFLCAACTLPIQGTKIVTLRGQAQYLSTQPSSLQDTCSGKDVFSSFSCSSKQDDGFSCFDVYQVEGDPIPAERYTLLQETITTQDNTPEPTCNFEGELTCANFLASLKYNLDFSWFITNFPSSSFPQCAQTYTCTRIACWRPLSPTSTGEEQSQKLMCVYKKEQTFFLGTQITCQDKIRHTK